MTVINTKYNILKYLKHNNNTNKYPRIALIKQL